MPGRLIAVTIVFLALAREGSAQVCVNKFLNRTEHARQVVTLLTGKLTYQEASALAQAIRNGQSPRLEWLGDSGRSIAKQYGELKVVRPMPVGCDGKKSGVIMVATFASVQKPVKKMNIKLDENLTVSFDEQTQ